MITKEIWRKKMVMNHIFGPSHMHIAHANLSLNFGNFYEKNKKKVTNCEQTQQNPIFGPNYTKNSPSFLQSMIFLGFNCNCISVSYVISREYLIFKFLHAYFSCLYLNSLCQLLASLINCSMLAVMPWLLYHC